MGTGEGDYSLMPDVIMVWAQDGSARLLDMNGYFFALSNTAAAMLAAVLKQDVTSAAKTIADSYGANPEQVRGDMQDFLLTLECDQLIRRTDSSTNKETIRQRAADPIAAIGLATFARLPRLSSLTIGALLAFAYLSIRLFGWPTTVAAWQRRCPVVTRRDLQWVDPGVLEKINDRLRDVTASHWLKVNCKERALACWALLYFIGVDATIVIGVDLFPLACHCWCTAGSTILSDHEDRCQYYRPIVFYPPRSQSAIPSDAML